MDNNALTTRKKYNQNSQIILQTGYQIIFYSISFRNYSPYKAFPPFIGNDFLS